MWHRVDYDDDDENYEEEELATSSNNKISIGASIFHFFPLQTFRHPYCTQFVERNAWIQCSVMIYDGGGAEQSE